MGTRLTKAKREAIALSHTGRAISSFNEADRTFAMSERAKDRFRKYILPAVLERTPNNRQAIFDAWNLYIEGLRDGLHITEKDYQYLLKDFS